jgi:ABC-type multidrug transport system ATPase subunit
MTPLVSPSTSMTLLPHSASDPVAAWAFDRVTHWYSASASPKKGLEAKASPALQSISWQLLQGQCAGLVGVNGAGKTTLIRCGLGLIKPAQGQAWIYNLPAGEAKARQRLAYLPERFLPPAWLQAQDYLKIICRFHHQPYDLAQARRHLNTMGLDSTLLSRRFGQFSKGMTQKIAWVGALLLKRDLWVLDEPMSGLDPLARDELRLHLSHLKREGVAWVMSTHALEDVQALCEQMLFLHQGRLCFAGSPAQFLAHSGETYLEKAVLRQIQKQDKAKKDPKDDPCESL